MWTFWRLIGIIRALYIGIFAEHELGKGDGCPLCGYEFNVYEGGVIVDGGSVAGTPNLPQGSWVEIEQTCPRCRHKFHVQDSTP